MTFRVAVNVHRAVGGTRRNVEAHLCARLRRDAVNDPVVTKHSGGPGHQPGNEHLTSCKHAVTIAQPPALPTVLKRRNQPYEESRRLRGHHAAERLAGRSIRLPRARRAARVHAYRHPDAGPRHRQRGCDLQRHSERAARSGALCRRRSHRVRADPRREPKRARRPHRLSNARVPRLPGTKPGFRRRHRRRIRRRPSNDKRRDVAVRGRPRHAQHVPLSRRAAAARAGYRRLGCRTRCAGGVRDVPQDVGRAAQHGSRGRRAHFRPQRRAHDVCRCHAAAFHEAGQPTSGSR